MKKAFLAGIVVLMALAMITCDAFPRGDKGEDEPKLVTVDGLPGVELTIGTSGTGRALSADNAETYTDFYEASFKGPNGTIYRAAWRAGQKGRIAVPFGDYENTASSGATAAIIFAGRYLDRTLLGVGKITAINGTALLPADPATIDSETTSVTFTINPWLNDVKSTAGTTFSVTGAPGPVDVLVKSDGRTITIPLFSVLPANPGPRANTASWALTCPNNDGVMIKEAGKLDSVGILTDAPVPGFKISAGATITPNTGAVTGTFTLSFSVPAEEGLSSLFIDIPVCALNITPQTFPETWHIRGGLKNYDFDEGRALESLGGALLIGSTAFAGPFEVTGTY